MLWYTDVEFVLVQTIELTRAHSGAVADQQTIEFGKLV